MALDILIWCGFPRFFSRFVGRINIYKDKEEPVSRWGTLCDRKQHKLILFIL